MRLLELKRVFDFTFSLIAVIVLMPAFLIISLLIYLEDRGPIFFQQNRVGRDEKLFTIYKFRSMRVNSINPLELGAVKHQHALVTRIGYFIRRFKLDEIPQFFNVLRGEMSLIGPRPCLPERIAMMSNQQRRRFNVRPGLTGWAEINGNVDLSWEDQLALDLWYIENTSLLLDFRIFLQTVMVVIYGSKRNEAALAEARKLL